MVAVFYVAHVAKLYFTLQKIGRHYFSLLVEAA